MKKRKLENMLFQSTSRRFPEAPPKGQHDFQIAIICALSVEASAVIASFDVVWPDQKYNKAPGDSNTYSFGAIGNYNIVLVHMSNIGKVAAATAATSLLLSFRNIQLALVVGVCGGVPFGQQKQDTNIFLGDVVVSKGLIQYDLRKQLANHRIERKDANWDTLPRPGPMARGVLAKLQTVEVWNAVSNKISEHFSEVQQKLGGELTYPELIIEDKLFRSTYQHKHHASSQCAQCANGDGGENICDDSLTMTCGELQCNEQELIVRKRPSQSSTPAIHVGMIASGDTVMKSGTDRDSIAFQDDIIAFDMEGAGVWEKFPSVLVVKGVCDYADSHKNKRWQLYAAAAAATATKSFLMTFGTDFLTTPLPTELFPCSEPDFTDRKIKVLKELRKSPYQDRKDINEDRIEGTCKWFVDHQLFRNWLEGKSLNVLWVSADPGCGKSVLIKYLVDSVLPTTGLRITSYFFFKDDFDDQRNIVTALCCILRQLFWQKRFLFTEKILEQFEAGGDKLTNSFSELWDILIATARNHDGEIVCLLDAIDECDEKGRSQLQRALFNLHRTGKELNLKFLLTSRPYSAIRRGFVHSESPEMPCIHLQGESEDEIQKISKEIDIFIKVKVRLTGIKLMLEEDEQEFLLQELMRVPNRTYLWVHLILDLIDHKDDIDKIGIIEATSHLPKTLNEAYEKILSRSRDSEAAKRLLHVVVAAGRPLTLKEMNVALALREGHRSFNDLQLKSEERFREIIRDLCGLFVTVIDSRIYLIHQTAKEFLIQNYEYNQVTRQVFQWKGSLWPQDSHRTLFDICIRYLFLAEWESYPLHHDKLLLRGIDNQAFLDYVAEYWTFHMREANVEVGDVIPSLLEVCDPHSSRCQVWFNIYWLKVHKDTPNNFTTLMVASYFGLNPIVKYLLENGEKRNTNIKDGKYGRSALSWAAGNGFSLTVKLLIHPYRTSGSRSKVFLPPWQVEIDSVDNYSQTPLSHAAWNGHADIVRQLLDAGAEIVSTDSIGGTPLSYAICNGHEAVVQLLVKGERTSKSDIIKSLHFPAVELGHEAVVRLLFENGADPNWKDSSGHTVLSLAAKRGYVAIVRQLLDYGAKPITNDFHYQSSLLWAVWYNYEDIVKLLLDEGDDPNNHDSYKRTPLVWAAGHGHENVVEILLKHGANPNKGDCCGQTPLFHATWNGHSAVVELLLKYGGDAKMEDVCGGTPLSWAREKQDWEIVELLEKALTT
ncbi:hypothetical protein BGW36DRAFT_428337 [Talaromyces proteolyticus]|uniref:Nucleoside phosphorylase domain-containing protein n=1 Tax=Talaromyces proteolyticus TaxID=1131652 RepID=A0AAD4KP74_9EURO|nr:uncharacterized protein BGW36DRAFT_428337 [Talaromyces proteolyticus]KAH8696324.1 hypothetical protein BGW36DRAFT_428337 [Talaromyces proteolyticus]